MHLYNPSKYIQTSGMGYEKLLWWEASSPSSIQYLTFVWKKKIPTSCPMWHVKMGTQAGRPDADEGQSNWEEWFGICPNPVHNWSQNDCKIQENGCSFTSVSASEV